jgi:hypothetical protein
MLAKLLAIYMISGRNNAHQLTTRAHMHFLRPQQSGCASDLISCRIHVALAGRARHEPSSPLAPRKGRTWRKRKVHGALLRVSRGMIAQDRSPLKPMAVLVSGSGDGGTGTD